MTLAAAGPPAEEEDTRMESKHIRHGGRRGKTLYKGSADADQGSSVGYQW